MFFKYSNQLSQFSLNPKPISKLPSFYKKKNKYYSLFPILGYKSKNNNDKPKYVDVIIKGRFWE